MNATPSVPSNSDARIKDLALTNPASLPAKGSPTTQQQAVEAAVQMSSGPEHARAATPRVPFSMAGPLLDDPSNALVADQRCVWVVTVDAPIEPMSQMPGSEPRTAQPFTVSFDVASGQFLDLLAGPAHPT